MDNKERFIEIYKEKITRPGSEKLLEFLCSKHSDFFTAPASTRYHLSYDGGLVEHSLHVYDCLKSYLESSRVKEMFGLEYSDETIAIVSLLHDLCKINVYHRSTRNVKDKDGNWTQVPTYEYNDLVPYGHGEKSVYIISGYMRLTREEAFAIRYHMGFSGSEDSKNVGAAFNLFPLAFALSVADQEATYYIENKGE